jgi:hypothetical protein
VRDGTRVAPSARGYDFLSDLQQAFLPALTPPSAA